MALVGWRQMVGYRRSCFAAVVVAAWTAPSSAEISFNVTLDDPTQQLAPWAASIQSHLVAAGAAWADELVGEASLEILVKPGSVARATGRSLTSAFFDVEDGKNVFEQGAAAEIRTGLDPNGAAFDIEIVLNPMYVADELWFDPDPTVRLAEVPTDRTDAMSVFLHELGHALAYNGWNDGKSNPAPNSFKSTWDCLLGFNGQLLVCNGPVVIDIWGSAPETTFCSRAHWGNAESVHAEVAPEGADDADLVQLDEQQRPVPLHRDGCCVPADAIGPDASRAAPPGEFLVDELMNGVVFIRGRRYWISWLDRAVLLEVGFVLGPNPKVCPGDADANRMVNFGDITTVLQRWLADYGVATGSGDANGDGVVTFADITSILHNWLVVCPN